ncbi:MAG: hypothetical protein ACKVKW_01380 [Flavobacteriales bacterium]|jgi:hypothetical protein|tara:strand:+ start:6115 stop:7038 length:924 start_codon:yes stop_codon:yes gene_type:complete
MDEGARMKPAWKDSDALKSQWSQWLRMGGGDQPANHLNYIDSLALRWGAVCGEATVLPMAWKRRWLLRVAYTPFAVQQWGPVGSCDAAELKALVAGIPRRFTKVDIAMSQPQGWQAPTGWHWGQRGRLNRWESLPNHELPLGQSYETIHTNYSKQCLRNLKKASKADLQAFDQDSPTLLIQTFQANQGRKYDVPSGYLSAMSQVMYQAMHQGRGKVLTLYGPGNQLHAGLFLIQSQNRVVMLFSCVTAAGLTSGAMTHLIDQAIIDAVGRYDLFDFEGSKAPGLARFYQGFGAKLVPYLRFQRYALL